MGKSSNRSTEYFFTGKYYDDDDGNNIVAIGVGGVIYAKGGDDRITLGSIGATVYADSGNKVVNGGAGYLKIVDKEGNLSVHGAAVIRVLIRAAMVIFHLLARREGLLSITGEATVISISLGRLLIMA